jgi:hypothetical protein
LKWLSLSTQLYSTTSIPPKLEFHTSALAPREIANLLIWGLLQATKLGFFMIRAIPVASTLFNNNTY